MRGDEIRDLLPEGLTVERYDQQGPLVDTEGITVRAPSGAVVMYALASAGEGPELDVLIFTDHAFRTKEGVGPGSLITDATLHYGFATLSFNTSNESREFVDFAYSPYTDIAFRVEDPQDTFAGIYPTPWNEYNETTDYRDDARIGTVWVMCRQSCPG